MENMHTHLGEFESDHFFATVGGMEMYPSAESLVAVAQEHFAFFSAAEEVGEVDGGEGMDDVELQEAEPESDLGTDDRLAIMKNSIAEIKLLLSKTSATLLDASEHG